MNTQPNMLVTTASSLEGYRIVEQFGVVFGESVFKHGFLKSAGASLSDTMDRLRFGSHELSGSTSLIQSAREHAYEKLVSQAKARGANAIIALDAENVIGEDVMYILLYGTAVRVLTEENYENEKKRQREIEEEKRARRESLAAAREEIRRWKEQQGSLPDSSPEEAFLAQMKEEDSVVDIWRIWTFHDLGKKYRNIDSYLNMRKDTEIQQGSLGNLAKIKEVIEKMLTESMQSASASGDGA